MTCPAHKMYGPKGVGALYVRRKPRVRIEAQIDGGGHERGMRSGTLPTHRIVGFGEAAELAQAEMATENERIRALRDTPAQGHRRTSKRSIVNGDLEHRLPHNLNISFTFVEGESLMMGIKDVAVSSGSACTSASLEPSYVLRALGVERRAGAHARSASASAASPPRKRSTTRSTLVASKVEQAARAVAALRDGQGRHRSRTPSQWAAH